jgi:hypothetical protein
MELTVDVTAYLPPSLVACPFLSIYMGAYRDRRIHAHYIPLFYEQLPRFVT